MIDAIYILSREQDNHRRDISKQKLIDSGVSSEDIHIFKAKSHTDYEKTSDLFKDAIADGFDFFEKAYQNGLQNKSYIGYMAQAYSYFLFWRHIQETEETAILMHDDTQFNCKFEYIREACNQLPSDFVVASLTSNISFCEPKPLWLDASSPFAYGLNKSLDWAVLYTPEWLKFISEIIDDIVLAESEGWIWSPIKNNDLLKTHKRTFNLKIRPIPQLMKRISSIQKDFDDYEIGEKQSSDGWKWSPSGGISELAYKSVLHDNVDFQWLRPLEETRD